MKKKKQKEKRERDARRAIGLKVQEDDWELEDRLYKQMKKGKISREEFERQTGQYDLECSLGIRKRIEEEKEKDLPKYGPQLPPTQEEAKKADAQEKVPKKKEPNTQHPKKQTRSKTQNRTNHPKRKAKRPILPFPKRKRRK